MLVRYANCANGRRKAAVYAKNEHHIARSSFDSQAIDIIRRLKNFGFEGYIVGGAVRDTLLGKQPKDIDIVTNATPQEVRKIFFRSRIIGNRFKLVHVYGGSEIYEVATFRAESENSNEYGTMAEDVMRRDFTMNALYYNPLNEELVDFVHGMEDIRKRQIKAIIPLETIFVDDPVRMLRAVKYAASFGLSIPAPVKKMILQNSALLENISASRLSEEFMKIVKSGNATQIFTTCEEYRLLAYFVPSFHNMMKTARFSPHFLEDLAALDAYERATGDKALDKLFVYLLKTVIQTSLSQSGLAHSRDSNMHVYSVIREFMKPLTLPRMAIEGAIQHYSGRADKAPFHRQKPRPRHVAGARQVPPS